MRVALTYNAKSEGSVSSGRPVDYYAEWDDMETIAAVRDALLKKHEEVHLVLADLDAFPRLRSLKPGIVFNMAEGTSGEGRESVIPSMLDFLSIPYTGSSPLTLALCLNKARAKEILSYHEIATPKYFVVREKGFRVPKGLTYPLIVKPLYEGSSKGVKNDSIVRDEASLRNKAESVFSDYNEPALIEEFLPGREFTVALLGNGASLKALPVVEINYSSLPEGANPIYSYEAKWVYDTPESPLDIFTCPAKLDAKLHKAITSVAVSAFNCLDVKDWCRIDIRLDSKGVPNIIELNPLPGILPNPEQNSCFPKAARAVGMGFPELVNEVLDCARKRYGI
ncbi:MAG: D-alanine--D-alanine ligase [Thermodesulfobacteriota bacterium]